jgi:hypothetical protein
MKKHAYIVSLLAVLFASTAQSGGCPISEPGTTPKGRVCCHEAIGSVYIPGVGTRNPINYSDDLSYDVVKCSQPALSGQKLLRDIIVQEQMGNRVFRMSHSGVVIWEYQGKFENNSSSVFDLRVYKDHVTFVIDGTYVTLSVANGDVISTSKIGDLSRCYHDGVQCLGDKVIVLESLQEVPSTNPRDAIIVNDIIYVADTFGHKVFAYKLSDQKYLWSVDSYYPNSIEFLDGAKRELVVAEEHANRVAAFDVRTGNRRLIYGCDRGPYFDATSTVEEIQAFEVLKEARKPDTRGICEGSRNLYSPNHVTFTGDGYLVSDTDNHRVLFLDREG